MKYPHRTGDSEKLVRVLFDLARHHAPSTVRADTWWGAAATPASESFCMVVSSELVSHARDPSTWQISSLPRGRSHPSTWQISPPSTWQDSSSDLVRDLFPTDLPPSPSKTSRRPRGAKSVDKMTVGSQFMTQLASLMRTINATDVHYIRYTSARLNL